MKRIFLSSDAGFKWDNFAIGLAARINYSMFDPDYSAVDDINNLVIFSDRSNSYNQNLNILNFEPGIFIRGGIKNVQLNIELTLSTEDQNKWFLNNESAFEVGLLINLNRKKSE